VKLAKCILSLTFILASSEGQDDPTQRALTNADVSNMVKSGMGDQTILLVIQKRPTAFDTSPEALITLKKDGVSDQVLNAILTTSGTRGVKGSVETANGSCVELFNKAIDAFGPREKLAAIHAVRWKAGITQTSSTGIAVSSQMERIGVYPDKAYVTTQIPGGSVTKMVVTPEFNYVSSGNMVNAVAAPVLTDVRDAIKTEPLYVAEHIADYSCTAEGTEQVGNVAAAKLKISGGGKEAHWSIDPITGRLLRFRIINAASREVVVDYSDWRLVQGVYVPFQRHRVEDGSVTNAAVSEYELNPTIDPKIFEPPNQSPAGAFTFKVLQSESVPYVVQTGGGISTSCQISGSSNTTYSSSTVGNSTFGNATTTPNLAMNCSSSETTYRWQHVLNAMLVEASDGNAYIIACDRAWRWSRCSGLRAGDVFNARLSDKGIVVQFLNAKHEEKEATYSVLQSKSLK